MSFIISSTGSAPPTIILADLGWRRNTPFTSINLANTYTLEELYNSKSLKDALAAGHITAQNEYGQSITETDKAGVVASEVNCEPIAPATATNVQDYLEYLQNNIVSGGSNVVEYNITSNNTITITHNRGRFVGVFVVDSTGEEIRNFEVKNLSVNQVQVNFGINITGKVIIF